MARRLSAILAADVVGYSRLMGADESGTLERLKALRREQVQPKITERGGRIVKLMGDGLLAEFPSVVEAVQCAVEIQMAIEETARNLPEDQQIRLRIGVNLGDIIADGSDIYGDGVNVAARLEALADPGGICVSGAVRDQLGRKTEFEFDPLGVQSLKNIAEPVAVYRLVGGAIRASQPAHGTLHVDMSLPDRPSIAVLPFQNMSADPEQEYFADGLTEDIITRLSYLRDLLVISRTSTFAYKGRTIRVEDVARDLGVAYVLEGSVRKVGHRVRITAQLIDCATGGHTWAQRYDRDLTDIFSIQDEITRAIVVAMQVKLTDGEMAKLEAGGTQNLDAWEAFLQGIVAVLKYTKSDIVDARNLFKQALSYDPNYIDAKVYLSWTHWIDARYGHVPDRVAAISSSRILLEEIKAIEPNSVNAAHLEAALLLVEGQHDEAIEAQNIAVQMGPCKIWGYTPAALVRFYCGDVQAAMDLLRTTMRLSPFCPPDTAYQSAYALALLGDNKNAVRAAEEYRRRVPGDPCAYTLQAIVFEFAGEPERARDAIRDLRNLYPGYALKDFLLHELYKDEKTLEGVVEVLRKAGLPE